MKSIATRISSSLVVAVAASLAALVGIVAAAILDNGTVATLEALLCGWSLAQVVRVAVSRPMPIREVVGHSVAAETKTPAAAG